MRTYTGRWLVLTACALLWASAESLPAVSVKTGGGPKVKAADSKDETNVKPATIKPVEAKAKPAEEKTPTVSPQINLENQEEEELAHAITTRSLNKYLLGNQWRSLMVGCTLAFWISVLPPVVFDKATAGTWWHQQAMMVAAAKYGVDVSRLLKRLLSRAAEGNISLGALAKTSSRVVKDPGPIASLLYVTVFLLVPGPVRFSLIPVLIEEITSSSRLAVDVLTITGALKKNTWREKLSKESLTAFKPFVALSLLTEVLVGFSLLSEVLLKGKVSYKTSAALLLYANVLYRRVLEIPELKENLVKKDFWAAHRAVVKSLGTGVGAAVDASVSFTKDVVASLEGHPTGDKIRKGLMIAGFLDPSVPQENKAAAE